MNECRKQINRFCFEGYEGLEGGQKPPWLPITDVSEKGDFKDEAQL